MPGTEVAVARIEEQMRGLVEDQKGFIEQRTARDQHIDLKFHGLQKQMQELSRDLRDHARAASTAAQAQSKASMLHEQADIQRFARLEWAALLAENWKKLATLFFAGVFCAVLLGSHGPELVAAIIKHAAE